MVECSIRHQVPGVNVVHRTGGGETGAATGAGYSPAEQMIAAAAREIGDGEVVFVGMRLPLIAFVVAKRTHAPRAIGLFENGVVRTTAATELVYTMADPPNLLGATECLDMLGVMGLLQAGRVHLGFLGAAEVDRFGNLNSTVVRSAGQSLRLPGSGGAADIASLAERFVVLLEHKKERLPERVSFRTSPGFGDGAGWRKRVGLVRGGPSAIITSKAVLRFNQEGEAYLASKHAGVAIEDVLANTGWNLLRADPVATTGEPSAEELRAIRAYDPEGFWSR
jgi:glutaconate CoA-transferase, subunit B